MTPTKKTTKKNEISPEDLLAMRLHNQRLSVQKERSPGALVAHLGAMQAQDLAMARWALGTRLQRTTEKTIRSAIDKGSVIRTHVLRPTWHFVPPRHLRWMLELSATRIRSSMQARNRQLGLGHAVFKKSNRLLQGLLKGRSVSREEIMHAFEQEGIDISDYRGGHLLLEAELEGIVCSGKSEDGKITYALLEERVAPQKAVERDKALGQLARLYFQGHGPATVADFTWWSGLAPGDCRQAIEARGSKLHTVHHNGQTLYFSGRSPVTHGKDQAFLLPAYDEYTIGYKDRSAATLEEHSKRTISKNGIFYPLVVIEGRVAGMWKKRKHKNGLEIEVHLFRRAGSREKDLIEAAAMKVGKFHSAKTILTYA